VQIVIAHPALAEFWVGGRASGGDDDGRKMQLIKIEGMIEPGTQHRGRSAGIFRRAEDDDRIRRMQLLKRRRAGNLNGSGKKKYENSCHQQEQQAYPPAAQQGMVGGFVGHLWRYFICVWMEVNTFFAVIFRARGLV
jgi:hypothetical protein